MNKASIVILNWNGREFLQKFLPKVIEYSQADAEIIIADNASLDSSIEFLEQNHPDLRIIQNFTNGGFAKGYNDSLKLVDSEYYILLNSDIEVTENWIAPILKLMDGDRRIAACQPKLLSYHNRDSFEYAGAAGGFIDRYGYPFCRGRVFQTIEKDLGQYNNPTEVFWTTGACMFVRAGLYHRFGGFDNDFFAHMEEIDFCWRLKNAGYKIMYSPDSVVYHVGGGTLPKQSSLKTYLNFRNNLTLIFKNLPTEQVPKVFITRLFFDWVAAIKFLFGAGFSDFLAVIRAQLFFFGHLRSQLRKRRLLTQSSVTGIYRRNIVIEYFYRRRKTFTQLDPNKFSE